MANDKMEIPAIAHHTACEMMARLEWITQSPNDILCIGYGDELLRQRYPDAKITNENDMLAAKDHSVDFIFANLYLPWQDDIKKIIQQWYRLLKPEGLLLFSSLGPDTLVELQENHSVIILPKTLDMHHIGDILTQTRFSDPVLDVEYVNVTYREIKAMIAELQSTNMIEKNIANIACQRNKDNLFSLTYEIIYGHAWRPIIMADHVADEFGVVRFPLSHLRRP